MQHEHHIGDKIWVPFEVVEILITKAQSEPGGYEVTYVLDYNGTKIYIDEKDELFDIERKMFIKL